MPRYRVSQRANENLRHIGLYTQREWGKVQRRKYLSGLDNKFSFLADNPLITLERQEFFFLLLGFISMKAISSFRRKLS